MRCFINFYCTLYILLLWCVWGGFFKGKLVGSIHLLVSIWEGGYLITHILVYICLGNTFKGSQAIFREKIGFS